MSNSPHPQLTAKRRRVLLTYAYDAWGNLAAEYSSGTETSPCGVATCYVTTDHLGSTRLITDGAGSTTAPSVVARYDYQPFGPEIAANYDGRPAALGYASTPDGVTEKFTGQARDPEMSTQGQASTGTGRAT